MGWNFRKYNGKLFIKPSKKAIDNVIRKISDVIKRAKAWNQENLIDALNPIIIGWSNYHRSVVSKEIFNNLDYRMWNMLWRWAKCRHPDKPKKWIINKYWHNAGSRNWVFSTERNRRKLFSDTKIVRHISLKMDKNLYLDSEYFKQRKLRQKTLKLTGRCKMGWDKLKDSLCV